MNVFESAFRIVTLILSETQCNKFTNLVKCDDIGEGNVIIGKGTVKNHIMNLLGIKSQKSIVINILLKKDILSKFSNIICKELEIDKPNHGIFYTTKVTVGEDIIKKKGNLEDKEGNSMFKKMTVVVNRGVAEDVMDIARSAGVTGGTILHGKGTGTERAIKLFGMEIESEKELVLMIMPSELVETVTNDLYEKLNLKTPGNGILFVEPIWDVCGLFGYKKN